MVFDHTSIIKTVLLRFCQRRDGRIPDMGARVTAANHIGSLLTEATARPPTASTTYQPVIDQIAQWKSDQYRSQVHARSAKDHVPSQPPTDFQQGLLAAQQRLRRHGLPPGQL
jgi:phospholipase C